MKFKCGKTQAEKQAKKNAKYQKELDHYVKITYWHDWFAWFPVKVGDADCRWLETVETRYTAWNNSWQDRAKVKNENQVG